MSNTRDGSSRRGATAQGGRRASAIRDDVKFLKEWATRPRETGAIAPSGSHLARAMAAQVDPSAPGLVVELGPGTGPITRALIARGIPPDRLVLIESNPEFAALLRERFPGVRVLDADAFQLARTVRTLTSEPLNAVVSGLPLFNEPMARLRLLGQVLSLIGRRGAFIQFSYHLLPPIPQKAGKFRMYGTRRIWLNMFPARVWVYRRAD